MKRWIKSFLNGKYSSPACTQLEHSCVPWNVYALSFTGSYLYETYLDKHSERKRGHRMALEKQTLQFEKYDVIGQALLKL